MCGFPSPHVQDTKQELRNNNNKKEKKKEVKTICKNMLLKKRKQATFTHLKHPFIPKLTVRERVDL